MTDGNYNAGDSDVEIKSNVLEMLSEFGRNLNQLASDGKIDPVVGREKEVERIIQILCRRIKNNPVLIGESGVGKTAKMCIRDRFMTIQVLCRRRKKSI